MIVLRSAQQGCKLALVLCSQLPGTVEIVLYFGGVTKVKVTFPILLLLECNKGR